MSVNGSNQTLYNTEKKSEAVVGLSYVSLAGRRAKAYMSYTPSMILPYLTKETYER